MEGQVLHQDGAPDQWVPQVLHCRRRQRRLQPDAEDPHLAARQGRDPDGQEHHDEEVHQRSDGGQPGPRQLVALCRWKHWLRVHQGWLERSCQGPHRAQDQGASQGRRHLQRRGRCSSPSYQHGPGKDILLPGLADPDQDHQRSNWNHRKFWAFKKEPKLIISKLSLSQFVLVTFLTWKLWQKKKLFLFW